MSRLPRPVLRYHGGKYRIASWVVNHFPAHRCYVEAYGGAASILLHKPRVYGEVYNDLQGSLVALFRVLRDPAQARELERLLRLTPYARAEFEASYVPAGDPIEAARRLICLSFMGYGSDSITRGHLTGFRNSAGGGSDLGTTPAANWANYPDVIPLFTARLQGVLIEQRPAIEIIRQFDNVETLHYVDPPYVHATRNEYLKHAYQFEMTDAEHRELANVLHHVNGMVVLSGYPCDLYDCELYPNWRRVTRKTVADGARSRIEALYFNPAALARMNGCLALEEDEHEPLP